MGIDRDDQQQERQARLDGMIEEFQTARRRRLATASGGLAERHVETEATPVVSVTSHHHRDEGDP